MRIWLDICPELMQKWIADNHQLLLLCRLEEKGVSHRKESRIYHMRNLNNWIKSMLIQDYVSKLANSGSLDCLTVLDLGCGKGGDLLKWDKSRAKHVVGLDIADTSIEQCKQRYEIMKVGQGLVTDP